MSPDPSRKPADTDDVERWAYDAMGAARLEARAAAGLDPATDAANAARFAARNEAQARYCHAWRRWLIYDGRRWAVDTTGAAMRLAKATARAIYGEAGSAEDQDTRKKLAAWAVRSEGEARLRAMLALAESEHGIPVQPDQLDQDPFLLNVANGTLDLRTGELRPHQRTHLLTKLAPVEYDPDAACPTFDAFLDRIFAGNVRLIEFLQRAVGYSLTGDTREQVLFLLHGSGANGKSTLLELVSELAGDYAAKAAFASFVAKRSEGVRNDIAALRGARFVFATEAEKGHRLAEALVKELTGGDSITARFLFGEFFTFRPSFKLWLAANHKPEIRGTDHAIWRRIRLIPFTVTIPEPERDRELPAKLRAELPGILAWAVRGCLAWQRDGLSAPPEVHAATASYRAEQDTLGAFLEECCELDPAATVPAGELYAAYEAWARAAGEEALSQTAFGRELTDRGFGKVRSRGGDPVRRIGLRLRGHSSRSDTVGHGSSGKFSPRPHRDEGIGKTVSNCVPGGNCVQGEDPELERYLAGGSA